MLVGTAVVVEMPEQESRLKAALARRCGYLNRTPEAAGAKG